MLFFPVNVVNYLHFTHFRVQRYYIFLKKHLFSYEKSIILWIIKIFYVLLQPELLKKS